ncbi:MAG: hypothetical protein ACPLOU_06585 [bacterium]
MRIRKLLALALVLLLSLGLSSILPGSSAAKAVVIPGSTNPGVTIEVKPQDGKLITPDGQELIPMEVVHAVSLEEEIASLSSIRIAEFVDLAHFEEKANSPLRRSTVAILGVETLDWESSPRTPEGALEIKVVKYSLAAVEPQVWQTSFPISGSLALNYIAAYGPYSGYIYLTISMNWTSSNQVLDVGFKYLDSPNFYYSRLSNGSGTAGFSLDPSRSFEIMIYNPSPPNDQTVNYSGTVILFFQ